MAEFLVLLPLIIEAAKTTPTCLLSHLFPARIYDLPSTDIYQPFFNPLDALSKILDFLMLEEMTNDIECLPMLLTRNFSPKC